MATESWLVGAVIGACLLPLVPIVLRPQAIVEDDTIVVRSIVRTRSIPRAEISGIESRRLFPGQAYCPGLHLRNRQTLLPVLAAVGGDNKTFAQLTGLRLQSDVETELNMIRERARRGEYDERVRELRQELETMRDSLEP